METGKITIEQAGEPVVETVSSILLEAAEWLNSQGTPLWSPEDLHPESILPHVTDGLFWLAKSDGVPAGCVRYQLEDRLCWPDADEGEAAYIHRLAVRRAFAGGAVATALIDWAKEYTRELGRPSLRLDCEANRPRLRRVYEAHDFQYHSETDVGKYHIARYQWRPSGPPHQDA